MRCRWSYQPGGDAGDGGGRSSEVDQSPRLLACTVHRRLHRCRLRLPGLFWSVGNLLLLYFRTYTIVLPHRHDVDPDLQKINQSINLFVNITSAQHSR